MQHSYRVGSNGVEMLELEMLLVSWEWGELWIGANRVGMSLFKFKSSSLGLLAFVYRSYNSVWCMDITYDRLRRGNPRNLILTHRLAHFCESVIPHKYNAHVGLNHNKNLELTWYVIDY